MEVAATSTRLADTVQRNYGYQAFVLALCLFALLIQAVEVFVRPDANTREVLNDADLALCGFFLLDFVVSLVRAPDRLRYLRTWGWIDLISSIPAVPALRWARVARITRAFRLLRAMRATAILTFFLLRRRAQSTFLSMLLIAMLLVVSASIGVLHSEAEAEGGIHTATDALWWSIGTLTMVGYSDASPVTHTGRIIGLLLTICGIGLFGIFTGYVASWFLAPGERDQTTELSEIQEELAGVKRAVERLEQRNGSRI